MLSTLALYALPLLCIFAVFNYLAKRSWVESAKKTHTDVMLKRRARAKASTHVDARIKAVLAKKDAEHPVTAVQLAGSTIGPQGMKEIKDQLAEQTQLSVLNLASVSLCSGVFDLRDALKSSTTLTVLNLDKDWLGDNGMVAIADLLSSSSSLRELRLSNNNISATGASTLSAALEVNTSLRSLDLEGNAVRDEGAAHILRALTHGQQLAHLNLANNDITDALGTVTNVLHEVLVHPNFYLRSLNLESNTVGLHDQCGGLAIALQGNKSLERLNLRANKLNIAGMKNIISALVDNKIMESLDVSQNMYMEEIAEECLSLLNVNKTLIQLSVGREARERIAPLLNRNLTLYWSLGNHAHFGRRRNQILRTTVAAALRAFEEDRLPYLPPEIWMHIFTFLRRIDLPNMVDW